MRVRRRAARSIAFEAFGVAAEVQFGDPELEAHVLEILPPGWRAIDPAAVVSRFSLDRTDADSYDVTINRHLAIEHASLDVALGLIDADLRMLIATNTPDWIFVHAGVVALRGRALVIPGESFSGKTTLVRALVEAGATYYSDEYAVLDYRPGAEWRPTTISAGEGTVAMLANTVPAQQRPGQSLRTLARALRNSCVLAGDRGEAAEAAHALFAQLASATS